MDGRSFYELFLVRQVIVQPKSPPKQRNIDSLETFVTNTEKVDLQCERNTVASLMPANQMYVLVADDDIKSNRLTLPKVLLAADFRKNFTQTQMGMVNKF